MSKLNEQLCDMLANDATKPIIVISAAVVIAFIGYGFYNLHVKVENLRCDNAVEIITDYDTCEAMKGCVINFSDIQKRSTAVRIDEMCKAKENG